MSTFPYKIHPGRGDMTELIPVGHKLRHGDVLTIQTQITPDDLAKVAFPGDTEKQHAEGYRKYFNVQKAFRASTVSWTSRSATSWTTSLVFACRPVLRRRSSCPRSRCRSRRLCPPARRPTAAPSLLFPATYLPGFHRDERCDMIFGSRPMY